MLLLPDQTYEQCQDTLTPLIALNHIIHGGNFKTIEEKQTINMARKFVLACSAEDSFNSQNINVDNDVSRSQTPESYSNTSEFFNKIPDFDGETIQPFHLPSNKSNTLNNNADLLRECESFLYKYRIRPDFFCRYRKAIKYDSIQYSFEIIKHLIMIYFFLIHLVIQTDQLVNLLHGLSRIKLIQSKQENCILRHPQTP